MPTTPNRPRVRVSLTEEERDLVLEYMDGRAVVVHMEDDGLARTTTYTTLGHELIPPRQPARLLTEAEYRAYLADLERANRGRHEATYELVTAKRDKEDAEAELKAVKGQRTELANALADQSRELETARQAARERALFATELHDREQAREAKIASLTRELEDTKRAHHGEASAVDRLTRDLEAVRGQASRYLADAVQAHEERDEALESVSDYEESYEREKRENGRLRAELLRVRALLDRPEATETVPVGYHGSRQRPARYDHDGVDHGLKVGPSVRVTSSHNPPRPAPTFAPDYVSMWQDAEGDPAPVWAAGPRDIRRSDAIRPLTEDEVDVLKERLLDGKSAGPEFVFDPLTLKYVVRHDPSDHYSI